MSRMILVHHHHAEEQMLMRDEVKHMRIRIDKREAATQRCDQRWAETEKRLKTLEVEIHRLRTEETLDRSLLELGLRVRARNCLRSAKLKTIRDLVSLSEQEVKNLQLLGKVSLTEIKSKLAERGLALKGGTP